MFSCASCSVQRATVSAKHGDLPSLPFCSAACSTAFCRLIGPKTKGEKPAAEETVCLSELACYPSSSWDGLPAEMKMEVLRHMPLLKVLEQSRISKDWASLASDEPMWRQLHARVSRLIETPDALVMPTWKVQTLAYMATIPLHGEHRHCCLHTTRSRRSPRNRVEGSRRVPHIPTPLRVGSRPPIAGAILFCVGPAHAPVTGRAPSPAGARRADWAANLR